MKTQSTYISKTQSHFVFIFLTSLGLGYSFTNQFILDKSNEDMLLMMICLFIVSIASKQRNKYNKS